MQGWEQNQDTDMDCAATRHTHGDLESKFLFNVLCSKSVRKDMEAFYNASLRENLRIH